MRYILAIIFLTSILSCGEKRTVISKSQLPKLNDTFYYIGKTHYSCPHIDFDTTTIDSAMLIRFHEDSVVYYFNMHQFMNSSHELDLAMPSIKALTTYNIHNKRYINRYKSEYLLAHDQISSITASSIVFIFDNNFLKSNAIQKTEFQGEKYR